MIWHPTSLSMRGIASRSIRRPLLHLLLVPASLGHQNPFGMLLFQHVLMNVEDVVSQAILVKTAQSLKPTNQLRLRRLNPGLMISSPIKILRHNIPAVVMMMVPQKMTWTIQKTPMLHRRCYEV